MEKQFVIIGNSAAGIAAVEAIRKLDRESRITVISEEDYPAYCRCLISYYLAGEVKEQKILYRPEGFYRENNVELLLNKKVTRVDPKKNRIVMEDKTQCGYDCLLISTGASPKFPEIAGIKKTNIFGFRTIKDAKSLEGLLPVTKSVCVLGGGLIGLKALYALKKRNIDVKAVIKSGQVLSQMLDYPAARIVQDRLEANGVELILGQDAVEIIGEGDIRAVKLDSGKVFGCSVVVVAKGVLSNTGLVRETAVKVNEGIVADKGLCTSVPNIYTAGDVCESFDMACGRLSLNALWPVAVEQGKVAGTNMAGGNVSYDGSLSMNAIEFFGLPVVSLGMYKIKEADPQYSEVKLLDEKAGLYKKLIFRDGFLVGAVLVGNIKNSGVFLRLIRERIEVAYFKDKMLDETFGYPDIMEQVKMKEHIYV